MRTGGNATSSIGCGQAVTDQDVNGIFSSHLEGNLYLKQSMRRKRLVVQTRGQETSSAIDEGRTQGGRCRVVGVDGVGVVSSRVARRARDNPRDGRSAEI